MTMRAPTITVLCFALHLSAPTAHAQVRFGPPGFQNVTTEAASESLRVIRDLEKKLRKAPRDASLWYRKGMIAWTLAARDYIPPPIEGLDWTLLGHLADSFRLIRLRNFSLRCEHRQFSSRCVRHNSR